ncbi:hypothetical protein KCU83_g179, partial [Aureobasidium melanogenum]
MPSLLQNGDFLLDFIFGIATKLNFAVCTPTEFVNDFIVVDEFSSRYRININIGNNPCSSGPRSDCSGGTLGVNKPGVTAGVLLGRMMSFGAQSRRVFGSSIERRRRRAGRLQLRHWRGLSGQQAASAGDRSECRLEVGFKANDWMSTADVADGVRRASQYCARAGPKLSDESPKTGNATTGEGGSCRSQS